MHFLIPSRYRPGVRVAFGLAAAAVVALASACARLLPTSSEPSTAFEPPRSWDAAIYFVFQDSLLSGTPVYLTTVEFDDGAQRRVLTSRDVFRASTNERRTPWYRVRPGKEGFSTIVRFTLDHGGGARTTAEWPVVIKRDEFATVIATVYTRRPDEWYISMPPVWKGFPLHPSARVQPGDSLWIEQTARSRDCFSCPK